MFLITSQYTIEVKLYNRRDKKYTTLSNTLSAIVDTMGNADAFLKEVPILSYIEDGYILYLEENGLTEDLVNVSSYKVLSEDDNVSFYFEEGVTKNTPKLMTKTLVPSSFLWSIDTYKNGIIYSWDSSILMRSLNDLRSELSTDPYLQILENSSYQFSNIIIEIIDSVNGQVLFTSNPGQEGFHKETLPEYGRYLREIKIYSSKKIFLHSTGSFEVFFEEYNTLTTESLEESQKEYRSILDYKIEEALPLFSSGVGYGEDLKIIKDNEEETNINYNATVKLLGNYNEDFNVYDRVSFYYRGNCSYKENYKIVEGKVLVSGNAFQYGNTKVRLYRYGSEKLKITYNLNAKLTYFTNEPDKNVKYWRTVDLKIAKEFVNDISPYLYYDEDTVKIKESLWRGVVSSSDKNIRDTLLDEARKKYNINGTIYHLYDYKISDVKVYGEAGDLYHQGHDGPLDVNFQYTGGEIDMNSTVRYFNKGLTVYEGEKYISAEIDINSKDILANADLKFPIYSRYNGKIMTESENLKISVYEKDDYVEAVLNETAQSCICRSKRVFNVPEKEIRLTEIASAYVFDFSEYIPEKLSGPNKFNMTINAIGKIGPVVEHHTGKTLNSNADKVTMKVIGERTIGKLCVEAQPVTKERTVTLYEPETEYLLGVVNGDRNTYDKIARGKKNLSVQFRPFMIPSHAYDINYSLDIKDVAPIGAVVDVEQTVSTDPYSYAFNLVFSSNHEGTSQRGEQEELASYTYAESFLKQEPKFSKYVIEKPATLTKEYTGFSVVVTTDNAEASVKEYNRNITFVGNTADVFVKTIPQKHPASPWSLKMRNGYYYLNQHEHYHFINPEPNGPKTVFNGEVYYDLTNGAVTLSPLPQQYAPVIVEDEFGTTYEYISGVTGEMTIEDSFTAKAGQKEFQTSRMRIDEATLEVFKNGQPFGDYIFADGLFYTTIPLEEGDNLVLKYKVKDSFCILPSEASANECVIKIHGKTPLSRAKIRYECSMDKNYQKLDVSVNPLHTLSKEGFLFIQEKEESVHSVEIKATDKLNQGESMKVFALVKDQHGNPCIGRTVEFSSTGTATLIAEQLKTDNNGVAIAVLTPNQSVEENVTAVCEGKTGSKRITPE